MYQLYNSPVACILFDMSKESELKEYAYDLPEDRIATAPAVPRDTSRLFVHDTATGAVTFGIFKDIAEHIPRNAILVFNDTKVVPARVSLYKKTGGKVEALFLVNEWSGRGPVRAMLSQGVAIGDTISADPAHVFTVLSSDTHYFTMAPEFPSEELIPLLWQKGTMPIPKYIKQHGLSEDIVRMKYQSMFAVNEASVAAPTASLHFTPEVLSSLAARSIEFAPITLHVGSGTFAPVTEENIRTGSLHPERFDISARTAELIASGKRAGRPIIAVGTTTTRALESSASDILSGCASFGATSIFIRPPYRFKIVEGLITNFHLPQSSLMALVDAFLQNKHSSHSIIDLYTRAVKERFRFYSFGDSMLIL